MAAAANIHGNARETLKSAKKAINRADMVIFFLLEAVTRTGSDYLSNKTVPRFIVANLAGLCHKRSLIARLIKGCRVDARTGCFVLRNN
jgi:hypothetical protein